MQRKPVGSPMFRCLLLKCDVSPLPTLAALVLACLPSFSLFPRLGTTDEPSPFSYPAGYVIPNVVEQGDDVIKDAESGQSNAVPQAAIPIEEVQPVVEPPLEDQDPPNERIGSRFFLHHQAGGQIGQPLPYTTLGAFYPVNLSDGIVFSQLQLLVDNDGNPGGGWTFGRRWYDADANRLWGLVGSYDVYQTHFHNTMQQLVISSESRGELWDVHANGYFPVSSTSRDAGLTIPGNVQFRANNLVRDLLDVRQELLSGVDVQISRRLGDNNLWGFGGWYHLEGGGQRTDGFLGGVRGYLTRRLAMDFSVADDPLFHTNVGFQFTYFFGGTSNGLVGPDNVYSRMGEAVQRREITAVRESLVPKGVQTLTAGGNPITITHVNDAGLGLGAGTFESPFGSLTDAAGSPSQIVLVHADSTFNGQQFILAPNQRLLGDAAGIAHAVFTDQLGAIPLPRATAGVLAPILINAPGNAMTMATNSELSGFDIRTPVGAAVFIGNTVNGPVNVNRISITGGSLQAMNTAGNFQLTDLTITNSLAEGVLLNNVAGGVLIDRGLVVGTGAAGILAMNVDVLMIRGVEIRNSAGPGIDLQVGGVNTMNATVQSNRFAGNALASSFGFAANAGATLNLNVFGNDDSVGYQFERDVNGQLRLGGALGVGGFFNDDNGNVTNNGNTTSGGAANVIISGAGNQIEIIDPITVPTP